ncbi:MAG: hypothetical protein U1E87_08560 [Alphaproteobacteria bacterium]
MKAKDAVQIAKAYLADLFKDEKLRAISLEEVEFDGGKWRVTLTLVRETLFPRTSPVASILYPEFDRQRKIVTVSDVDGTVLSVRDQLELVT